MLFLFPPASAAVGQVITEKQGKKTRTAIAPNIWPAEHLASGSRGQAPQQNRVVPQACFVSLLSVFFHYSFDSSALEVVGGVQNSYISTEALPALRKSLTLASTDLPVSS